MDTEESETCVPNLDAVVVLKCLISILLVRKFNSIGNVFFFFFSVLLFFFSFFFLLLLLHRSSQVQRLTTILYKCFCRQRDIR